MGLRESPAPSPALSVASIGWLVARAADVG